MARWTVRGVVFEGFYPPKRLVARETRSAIIPIALTLPFTALVFLIEADLAAFLPGIVIGIVAGAAGTYIGDRLASRIHRETVASGCVLPWWRRRFGRNGAFVWTLFYVGLFAAYLLVSDTWMRQAEPPVVASWVFAVYLTAVGFYVGYPAGLAGFERRSGTVLWYQIGAELPGRHGSRRTPVYFTQASTHSPSGDRNASRIGR